MKLTLLDMTQDIISALESDEVNSITDTVEALQVARVIRDCYTEIIARIEAPEKRTFFELNASGNPLQPTVMYIPDGVDSLESLRYDKADVDYPSLNYVELKPEPVQMFLDRVYNFRTEDADVGSYTLNVGSDTFDILYRSNKHPEFYTVFDDKTVLLDSYRIDLGSTLLKNKSMAYGLKAPVFSFNDTFIPELDDNLFPLLMQESKSQAFVEIKQSQNPKAEQKARRQWVHTQKAKDKVQSDPYHDLRNSPNYGRRGGGGTSSVFIVPKAYREK